MVEEEVEEEVDEEMDVKKVEEDLEEEVVVVEEVLHKAKVFSFDLPPP